MNAKVQEFINKMKKRECERAELKKLEENSVKIEHLVALGLLDVNKCIYKRAYISFHDGSEDLRYDSKEKKFFKILKQFDAIDITDDEYQEILKYAPIKAENCEDKKLQEPSPTCANLIQVVAYILLFISILGGLISLSSGEWVPFVFIVIYCLLGCPLIIGFSKIVAVAEKKLYK